MPEPEASEDDIYGKYLFGQDRELEDDTDEEQELLHAMGRYFSNEIEPGPLKSIIPTLQQLVSQGKYTDFLKAPSGLTLYRGMSMSPKEAVSFFPALQEIVDNPVAQEYWEFTEGLPTHNPSGNIRSWTYNPKVVNTFVGNYNKTGINVVLVANGSQDNFLLNTKAIGNAIRSSFRTFLKRESEVLCVGPVKLDKIYASRNDFDLSSVIAL